MKEVASCGAFKRRLCDQDDGGYVPDQVRTGVGNSLGLCRPTSPGLHVVNCL